MASGENHTVYGEEDLDEDEDEEVSEEENHPPLDDDDEDVFDEDDSISSAAGEVTIAVAGVPNTAAVTTAPAAVQSSSVVPLPDLKRQRIDDAMIPTTVGERKPMPLDESRKLFQRLWTDEDEIELLQGFLDYTTSRGPNSSSHHHDTTAFYDQVKNKLQLDFNKNQLVEKLRRLKKKYRNVVSKISSGKEYVFKTPHDQATFEISCKIWSGLAAGGSGGSGLATVGIEGTGLDYEDANPSPYSNSTPNLTFNLNDHNINGFDPNSSENKVPRSRKRSRGGVKVEEKPPQVFNQQPEQSVAASIPNLVEETVKSCLSPLFKELLTNAVNGSYASRGLGGVNLNPMPLGFSGSLKCSGGDVADEKWRKQHISELEVYSKRLELVQDEIKLQLEELRAMGS